jgi:hypothetical protein
VQQIDNLAGEALEFVVEIVGEVIDALVRAIDTSADFGEVLGLFMARLVHLGPELAQQFLEFLLERRPPLEVVDDFEKDEKDRAERGGIDKPGGEMRRVRRRNFLTK